MPEEFDTDDSLEIEIAGANAPVRNFVASVIDNALREQGFTDTTIQTGNGVQEPVESVEFPTVGAVMRAKYSSIFSAPVNITYADDTEEAVNLDGEVIGSDADVDDPVTLDD